MNSLQGCVYGFHRLFGGLWHLAQAARLCTWKAWLGRFDWFLGGGPCSRVLAQTSICLFVLIQRRLHLMFAAAVIRQVVPRTLREWLSVESSTVGVWSGVRSWFGFLLLEELLNCNFLLLEPQFLLLILPLGLDNLWRKQGDLFDEESSRFWNVQRILVPIQLT